MHNYRNCKDNDKDNDIKQHNSNILDGIKQYEINDIECLIFHIECVLFKLKNNYIFRIHNVPYNHKVPPKQIQTMKHDIELYNHQLKFLLYFKQMNYDYVSDIHPIQIQSAL